jgi:hypothetical protein
MGYLVVKLIDVRSQLIMNTSIFLLHDASSRTAILPKSRNLRPKQEDNA